MTKFIATNNAGSKLAAPISAGETSLTLTAGTGALFPSPTATQQFPVTVTDAGTGLLIEIMYCTSRTGDVLTVVRGQEGTTARAYVLYDVVAAFFTAAEFTNLCQGPSDQVGGFSAVQVYAGNPNGHIAGNQASAPVTPPSLVWDTTNSIFWYCSTTGTAGSAVWQTTGAVLGTLYCGTSTGSANAQILTPTVPLVAYAAGVSLSFVAGFTNSNALQVNVSGLGLRNVYKDGPAGPIPLTGGEVVVGNLLSMRDDGTRFQLTATELGTAALANATSNTGNVAAVTGPMTIGNLASYSDTAGSLQDSGVSAVNAAVSQFLIMAQGII